MHFQQGFRYEQLGPGRQVEQYTPAPPPPQVPVTQHFSPSRKILNNPNGYISEIIEEKDEDPPTPQQLPEQAIRLNLLNLKEDSPGQKNPMEPSKTLSPDRKPYAIFEGVNSSYDRNTGFFTPHSGMIKVKDTEVNSSRNSPQRMEYKKYYSPTQKSRSNFTNKLFEMTKALQQESTDTAEHFQVRPTPSK